MRSMLMSGPLRIGLMLVVLGWSTAGAVLLAGGGAGGPEPAATSAQTPKTRGRSARLEPPPAELPEPPRPKRRDTNPRLKPKRAELTASVEPARAKPGDTVTLKVTAKLDPDYHIYEYSKMAAKPEGPVYTAFDLFDTGGLEVQGDWSASKKPIRHRDANWPDLPFVEYHQYGVTWSIRLEIPPDAPPGKRTLRVQAGYMICNDKACTVPGRWTLPAAAFEVVRAD
jgi:Disulphide bond corrector protein DsbC